MQRFDPTSVWCAAPAEAPLLLCISLLSVFLSLRTQMSQTKALKQRTVFQFNMSNKRKCKRVPLWSHSQQHYRHLALYLLNHVFIWPKMPWGVIKFGQLVQNNNYLFVPFNFPSRVEHKEKREHLIERWLAGLPVIVWTAVELSDVDGEIMGHAVKEESFNKRFPCRHTYQQGNSSTRLTALLHSRENILPAVA